MRGLWGERHRSVADTQAYVWRFLKSITLFLFFGEHAALLAEHVLLARFFILDLLSGQVFRSWVRAHFFFKPQSASDVCFNPLRFPEQPIAHRPRVFMVQYFQDKLPVIVVEVFRLLLR
jgi:hypothetical protein